MSALPDDSWFLALRPQPELLTAEQYDSLPEEISKAIEVVGGYVFFCEAPAWGHQVVARRLANLLEQHAREAMKRGSGCLTVANDVDLRLRDVPLVVRRPDVVLNRCVEDRERIRAEHALLVVEIVSPSSEVVDSSDKLAEYAKAGIPNYWIVRRDEIGISLVECYQLDPASMTYKHLGTFMRDELGGYPEIKVPIPIILEWPELQV